MSWMANLKHQENKNIFMQITTQTIINKIYTLSTGKNMLTTEVRKFKIVCHMTQIFHHMTHIQI